MTLVVQSFGNEVEYRRAILAVLSFYARIDRRQLPSALFFTDNPLFFKEVFTGLPITFVALTPERIREMRGRIDFLHRIKIAIIDEAFNLSDDDLLYIDSDTFVTADPMIIKDHLSANVAFMHVKEYAFQALLDIELPAGQPFHDFVRLIDRNQFELSNGDLCEIRLQQESWNAGVMAFHRSHAKFLPDVFALTDQFYPLTRNHASEQYAFSIVLQNAVQVRACDHVVFHYWHRVKKTIVDRLLFRRVTSAWMTGSLENKLQDVRAWTTTLPTSIDRNVLWLRDLAIQEFCKNRFKQGLKYAFKAMTKDPMDGRFLKDTLYHTLRGLKIK